MARVILVRHGQTEWNRIERFRGLVDIDLNETGVWQADRIGEAVAGRYSISAIFSSPLIRAMRTAEAIGRATGVPVQSYPALVDFSYGVWEGKSPEEVEAAYPDLYRIWLTQPQRVKIPGGESLRNLRLRASTALLTIARDHPKDTVVLVSHRAVCKVLACYLLGLPNSQLWKLELDNGSFSVFEEWDVGWVTRSLNETCHLRRSAESSPSPFGRGSG